jgi:hypothetical protein
MDDPRAPAPDPTATALDAAAAPEPVRCLVCGSAHVEREGRLRAGLLALALALLGAGLEDAPGRARYRCGVCSYRWRDGDRLEGRVPAIG